MPQEYKIYRSKSDFNMKVTASVMDKSYDPDPESNREIPEITTNGMEIIFSNGTIGTMPEPRFNELYELDI